MSAFPTNEHILLSIVIPTYNYSDVVVRAVHSVMDQMSEACELIVIDDGSQDNTGEVLAAITPPPHLECRFVRQDNAGPASARNHGLRLSKGEYILFLDADDELLPGAVSTIIRTLSSRPDAGLILCAHINRFFDGREKIALPTPIGGNPRERIENYLLSKRISVLHGASIFRRELVVSRPYPEQLRQTEDIPVFAHLVAYAVSTLIHEPIVRIHKHPDSLRHNRKYAQANFEALVTEVFSTLPEECQDLRAQYTAKRALSIFRACCRSGQYANARQYYHRAFLTDWRRAIKPKYFLYYLSSFVKRATIDQNA